MRLPCSDGDDRRPPSCRIGRRGGWVTESARSDHAAGAAGSSTQGLTHGEVGDDRRVDGNGLSAAAGLNAYIPFLIVALIAKYTDVITLPASYAWMESWWAIGIVPCCC